MRRFAAGLAALLGALTLSAAAPPPPAAAAPPRHATGTIAAVGGSWFTVTTAGRRTGVVNALSATADAITRADYPYVWAGGHPEAGVPSATDGTTGGAIGYDCSGAVAAVLAGAGLWAPGSPVPNDAGVIAQLQQEGLIAPGPGQAPVEVTLYDYPGVHIFMNIDGRFFGTSDGAGGGSRRGGAGWLYDGAPDASSPDYHAYHFLPWVLRDSTIYGHMVTFQAGSWSVLQGAGVGDRVKVTYREARSGAFVARTLAYLGAKTVNGTLTTLGRRGRMLALTTAGGKTFALTLRGGLPGGLQLGDLVTATYSRTGKQLILRAITVIASPQPGEATGTVTALAPNGSSLTLQTADGRTLTFATALAPGLLSTVALGDTVKVDYVALGQALTAHSLAVTATPAASGSDPSAGSSPPAPSPGS